MVAQAADWIIEHCTTIGKGDLILSGSDDSFIKFRDAFPEETPVVYSISDGFNRETGTGTFNGVNTITRDSVVSTLFEGTYTEDSPEPIYLGGSAMVACTFNASSFEVAMNHPFREDNPHKVTAVQVGAVRAFEQDEEPGDAGTGDIWIDTGA